MALASQDFASWVIDRLARRGRVVIPSRGRSMQPAIPDGAYLEVRPVAFGELRCGDIVVFHYAGDVFCHRFLRRAGRHCVLKGDTLLSADPPIVWGQVIGRVSTILRGDGRLVRLDAPGRRLRSAVRARLTYPIALAYHAGSALRRLATWSRGVRLPND